MKRLAGVRTSSGLHSAVGNEVTWQPGEEMTTSTAAGALYERGPRSRNSDRVV